MARDFGKIVEANQLHFSDPQINLEQFDHDFYSPEPVSYQDQGNRDLPIFAAKAEILSALKQSQVVIIEAATGCGKSTQAPQYGLELGFALTTLTQPRRRAAQNVAERIRSEQTDSMGIFDSEGLVSYQTGAGLDGPRNARIQVVTDGLYLLRDAHNFDTSIEELLIIDEVHESNINMEIILGLAKQKCAINPNFKVIIMSASMKSEQLATFMTDTSGSVPPIINVKGRMFDVEKREEPESSVVKQGVAAAKDIFENPEAYDNSNCIQIFVEGKKEIKDTIDGMRRTLPPEIRAQATFIPLHSMLSPELQQPAFEDQPGIKIVVETKMGQTSNTIPRTRYVISSGTERRTELADDDEEAVALMKRPISQADILQQAGRGGRTNPSIFVLTKLNETSHFIATESRDEYSIPEIYRIQLDGVVLMEAAHGKDLADLDTRHKIDPVRIGRAKDRLQVLGALDQDGIITEKGLGMSRYPAQPSAACSMYETESRSQEIRGYMAAIVASGEMDGIHIRDKDSAKRWLQLTDESTSDALAQLDIYIAAQKMTFDEMHLHDIDVNKILRAHELYRKLAQQAGADPNQILLSPSAAERVQLRECIALGLINNIYVPAGDGMYQLLGKTAVLREISNQSITHGGMNAVVGQPRDVAIKRNGVPEMKHVIENPTEISMADIGRLAVHLTQWVTTGYGLREQKFVAKQSNLLAGHRLATREVSAEPSPRLRNAVIEHVKVNPGPNLVGLYQIKRQTERLAHLSKYPVKRLSEDMIDDLIAQAAPDDISDLSLLENKLRELIVGNKMCLESFISKKQQAQITRDAPETIRVQDIEFKLRYVQGKPVVRRWSAAAISRLDDNVCLPDGRQLYFYIDSNKRDAKRDSSKYTLAQIKKIIQDEGWL